MQKYFSYYIATAPGRPGVRHLYRRHVTEDQHTCLTCPGARQLRNSSRCVPPPAPCDWAEVTLTPATPPTGYILHCGGNTRATVNTS